MGRFRNKRKARKSEREQNRARKRADRRSRKNTRKDDRSDRRADKKAEKAAQRLAKKQARWDAKLLRQGQRQDSQTDRASLRQEGRTDRVIERTDAKETAYEMGIDPNAAMWDGIGSATQAVGNTVSNLGFAGVFDKNDSPSDVIGFQPDLVQNLEEGFIADPRDDEKENRGFFDWLFDLLGI